MNEKTDPVARLRELADEVEADNTWPKGTVGHYQANRWLASLREIASSIEGQDHKLQVRLRLMQSAVDRWVPCPDHRDKTERGRCYVCENESLRSQLARTAAQEDRT